MFIKSNAYVHGISFVIVVPIYNPNLSLEHFRACLMAPHVVVIPYPSQSHITPLFHLSKNLASNGIVVTFVLTEYIHSKMMKARRGDEINFNSAFDIRLAQISDGLPLDFDGSANAVEYYNSINNMENALEDLIHRLNRANPHVSHIVASSFLYWTYDVANKFDIPWIFFWSQCVTCFVIYNYLSRMVSNGHFPPKSADDRIDYIPGLPMLEPKDLPSEIQNGDSASLFHQLILRQFELINKAKWVIGNTVYDLENGPKMIRDINTENKASLWTEANCLPWLDSKPRSSVLYISFGSTIQMSKTQVQEIAMGLLESQQLFLWVLRPDIVKLDEDDVLPEGFLEKTKDQGLVIPWSSQVLVLSHPSIGGFFTHGGWNSTIESLSLGVPMLVLPHWYDQFTNRMLTVKQWKIGLKLEVHRDDGIVEGEEISKAVKELMQGEQAKEIRKKATELRDRVRQATSEGGSSHKNLQTFVHYLVSEKRKKNATSIGTALK
eukprot:Gb_06929 [translate_table: standard]